MKKGQKNISKLLAVFLSVLFVAEILPTQIIAEAYNDLTKDKSYTNDLIENPTVNKENAADILYEVVEKRDEYTKVYKKSDGSYTALVSKSPIHHFDNGVWKEINNTLISENSSYTNISNTFNVLFPKTISDNSQITVEANGSELSFSVDNINSSNGSVENAVAKFDTAIESAENALANTQSSVKYENINEGTDIQYTVLPNAIKENVIVSSKDDLKKSYSFIITTGELSYTLNSDGSIDFSDGSEIKFSIPRPVMTDSNYSFSYDIDVDVSDNGDGTVTLTYTPSADWTDSNDRVYPVNIDPAIVIPDDGYSENAFVESDKPTENFYNTSAAIISNGKIADKNTNDIVDSNLYSEFYVKFDLDSIKCLTKSITPTNVQMVTSGGAFNIAAYELTSVCDFQTVTYETKPSKAETPLDFYTGKDAYSEAEFIHFDITELFDDWLNRRSPNWGIAIAGYNENIPGGGLLFTREPYGATMLVIDYVETSGYNSAYSYQQNDILLAGTSYINNFSRQLFIKRNDFSLNGNIMPVELSFMYNSGISQKQGVSTPYGNNWLTNYNRLIYIYESDVGQPYLCYADENGSIKYFTTDVDSDGNPVFKDEFEDVYGDSGISVTYNAPLGSDFDLSDIQISNNGYTENFDALGRLIKITNNHGKYIEIIYSDSTDLYKISKIKDGVGREYRFTYSDGKLSNIRCYTAQGAPIYAGSSTSVYLKNEYYYDDGGNLERVKFPDGSNAYYMYNSDNLLIEASSRNLYKLEYTYNGNDRVRRVTECARENTLASYTMGKIVTFMPLGPRYVRIYDNCGREQYVQFDKCGLVSQIVDEKGNVYSAETGSLVPTSQNLLLNTSFENDLAYWSAETESIPAVEADNAYHGNKALKLSTALNDDGSYDSQAIYQEVSVNGGGSYTLSAYVKSTETSDDSSLLMAIFACDENGNELTLNSRAVSGVANGYQRHDVVLNAPENTKKIKIIIGTEKTQGAFYVDAVQLENQSGASSYNMLNNGSFTNSGSGWDIQSNGAYRIYDYSVNGKERNVVSFDKNYDADITVSQTVTVNAKKDDIITFGGWIKSNTVSNDGNNSLGIIEPDLTNFLNDRFAGLVITYEYFSKDENGQNVLNTVVEKKAVNDCIDEWQYLENSIIMLADAQTVTVSFEFKKHKAEVEMADLCLSKDSIDYGNSADETDVDELSPEEQEASTEAPTEENADICKCSDCTNARCTCTCVNENLCNCTTCRKMFDITYDENGNILSITICGYELSELQSISMERAYSADGNYLKSSKDENGNTVLYNYDLNNGLLKSETDAENNLKNYAYSLSGKLTKAETNVSNLTDSEYLRTNYGYLNGNLTTITHNGFTYYIEYDKWNNVERVSAHEVSAILNASSVAAYTYNGDSKHDQLKKITYGNGGTVDYTYDEFDRVIGISYGGAKNTFEYTYDTLGNIISVVDNFTGRKVFYNGDTVSVYTDDDTILYYRGTDFSGNEIEYSGGVLYTTEKELDGTKISSGKLKTVLSSDSDSFGRISKKAIELHNVDTESENGYTKIETNYSYGSYSGSEGTVASGKVKSISSAVSLGENTVKDYTLSYEYDANGNITHEYSGSGEGRKLRYRYTYDEAEQLVRVDDAVQNKTYVYAYDKGGNRVSEKTYAFTTSDTLGAIVETKTSQYNYLVWKDRLSSFNGSEVKYDSAGNPTSYGDKMLYWKGKLLKEIALSDGSSTEFEYDANGLRTQKRQYRNDGLLDYIVDYVWEDGKLQAQYLTLIVYTTFNGVQKANKVGPFSSKIIYDDSGLPQGFMLNDVSQFAFVRNLQGDVIAVIDENGNIAMEYSYDPWGNIEYHLNEDFSSEQDALMFTALCPLTYRGYNYDFTTGLYYLQSRYYNPEWGRFINCDDTNILLATQGETHNANLFAYCANNPVNKVDYTGYDYSDIDIKDLVQFLILLFAANFYDSISISSDAILIKQNDIYISSQKGGINVKLATEITISDGSKATLDDYFNMVDDLVNENHKKYFLNSKINIFKKKEKKTPVKKIESDIGFYFIALLATYKFYEEFPQKHKDQYPDNPTGKRDFLLSDECVAKEIKMHYLAWKGVKWVDTDWNIIKTKAEDVNIFEQDVLNWNRYAFSYKDGIRKKYKNTLANPFYDPDTNEITNKVRESWKTEKIPDNI